MTTLIIGSDGLIGKELQKHIKKECILLDINYKSKFTDVVQEKKFNFDITCESSIEALVSYLERNSLKISKFVYLLGETNQKNIFNCSIEEWEKTFKLNVTCFFIIFKHLYRFYNENHTSIVTLSSQNGIVGHEDRIAYGPSKAAMIQLVKNLTIDIENYSTKNIRINTVSPSYIINSEDYDYFSKYPGKKLIERIPHKKRVDLTSVINGIILLLSGETDSIRGHNFVIDNGYTIC